MGVAIRVAVGRRLLLVASEKCQPSQRWGPCVMLSFCRVPKEVTVTRMGYLGVEISVDVATFGIGIRSWLN